MLGSRRVRVRLASWMAIAGAALVLAGPTATAGAGASGSTTSIATSQFVNQFDAEPYVGNGYFSQRIPAAGAGLLTGLGTIGWPLGTPRFTEALAAGLYAVTNASVQYYPDETRQVIALIPTWSTLNFASPAGDTYSPATVTPSQISNYLQTEDLQTGTVTTTGTWTSSHGNQANFKYQVFTDLARKHVRVVSLSLTPQWNGKTTVTGLLDGNGASRLQPAGAGVDLGSHTSHVLSTAIGTSFRVAESSTLQFSPTASLDQSVGLDQPQSAGEQITFTARAGQTYTFTKYVGVVTNRDSSNPAADAQSESTHAASLGQAALQSENTLGGCL